MYTQGISGKNAAEHCTNLTGYMSSVAKMAKNGSLIYCFDCLSVTFSIGPRKL